MKVTTFTAKSNLLYGSSFSGSKRPGRDADPYHSNAEAYLYKDAKIYTAL